MILVFLQHSLAELSNATQQPQALVSNESKAQIESILSKIAELVVNVTAVNTTLGTRVEWIKQDQDKVRVRWYNFDNFCPKMEE